MAWEKVSNYCIKQAGYFISKTGIDENTRYTLFKGNDCVEIFKTADEAKAKYEEVK
jgi:hypothetical protein